MVDEFELAGWRRAVAELYASVRAESDPGAGHALWRAGRDRLFQTSSQSPLSAGHPLRTGLPYADYDPAMRFELALSPHDGEPRRLVVPTGAEERTAMRLIGQVTLPDPLGATLGVWWLEQYGGGLFIPVRDATAGGLTYGGGRYLLDTAKGADLGGEGDRLVVDLNFLYHPSCRYDPAWQCPLAPPDNTVACAIPVGELL